MLDVARPCHILGLLATMSSWLAQADKGFQTSGQWMTERPVRPRRFNAHQHADDVLAFPGWKRR